MDIDFSKLPLIELNDITERATAARNRIVSARRREILLELNELTQLEDAPFKARRPRTDGRYKRKVYRDANGNVWRSSQKMPQWLKDHIAAGGKKEDLEVEE